MPIRYLKLIQPKAYMNLEEYDSSARRIPSLLGLDVVTSTGTNLSNDKPIVNLNVIEGQVSDHVSLGIQPASCYSYNKIHYQDLDISINPNALTSTQTGYAQFYPRTKYDSTQPGDCRYAHYEVTIDLQNPYNTIKDIRLSAGSFSTNSQYETMEMYASLDNQNWTRIGTFINNIPQYVSGKTMIMIPDGAMPPNV